MVNGPGFRRDAVSARRRLPPSRIRQGFVVSGKGTLGYGRSWKGSGALPRAGVAVQEGPSFVFSWNVSHSASGSPAAVATPNHVAELT
jgi:hypothetical protein